MTLKQNKHYLFRSYHTGKTYVFKYLEFKIITPDPHDKFRQHRIYIIEIMTKDGPIKSTMGEFSLKNIIREANELDIALYENATSEFEYM